MGLFKRKETDEKKAKRLAENAGYFVEMFKAAFKAPQGYIDATQALIFTASIAGYACHQAVKAEKGTFAVVTDKNGKKYYFGDAVNKYLLEDNLSVVGFCTAVTGVSQEEVLAIVAKAAAAVGDESYTLFGYDLKDLYKKVDECWKAVHDRMIAKYCKSPSDWPVMFGIVLQNILNMSLKAGAPEDEAGRIAIECAVVISKMDDDSL